MFTASKSANRKQLSARRSPALLECDTLKLRLTPHPISVKDSEVVNGVIHTAISVNAGNTVNWRFGGYGTTVLVR